jgi:hypothetical protein
VKLPPRGQECFLSRIFARSKIAQNSKRNSANHRLVTCNDFNEGTFVAAAGSLNQPGIGGRFRCREVPPMLALGFVPIE